MSINKLIADMDMEHEIVDLSQEECTEKTRVKSKDGTCIIISSQKETETNDGEREVILQNGNPKEINWDLLEMESDHEQVKFFMESQGSDNSVLLIEAGSDSLQMGSRDEDMDMTESNNLGLEVEEKGNDNLKGLNQSIMVSSSGSRAGSENMMSELSVFNGLTTENREQLNDKNLNSSLCVHEKKESVAVQKVGFGIVSENCKEMETQIMQALEKDEDPGVEVNQRVCLNVGTHNNSYLGTKDSSVMDIKKKFESKKSEQLAFVIHRKVSEIDNMEGLNENCDSAVCKDINMLLGTRDADLEGSISSSIVSSIETESKGYSRKMDVGSILAEKNNANADFVLKESVNSDVLKDGEMNDSGYEEGGHAKSILVRGDSNMNGMELNLDTCVQDTPAGAHQEAKINRKQTDMGPIMKTVEGRKFLKRKRGRPRKENKNMNDANTNSALVSYNTRESSSSLVKRQRRESKYLRKPYAIIDEGSQKRPRKKGKKLKNAEDDKTEKSSEELVWDLISAAQGLLSPDNPILSKLTRGFLIAFRNSVTSEDNVRISRELDYLKMPRKFGKKLKNAQVDKTKKSSRAILDLISVAQGPISPENSILSKPTRRFLIAFRNSVSFVNNGIISPGLAVASSPVLLDARDKLEEIIMSLKGSGLEKMESLIGDAQGLLKKFNLALTTNSTIGIEV